MRRNKWCVQFALIVVVLVLFAGCASQPDVTDSKADLDASQEGAAGFDLESIPERDVSGWDVCAKLPGEAVAEATGWQLVNASPDRDLVSCTYLLRGDAPYEERIDVSLLGNMGSFAMGRQVASDVEAVAGIGVDGYLKKVLGGSYEVRVVREDGIYITANAPDREKALAIARLAVDKIEK